MPSIIAPHHILVLGAALPLNGSTPASMLNNNTLSASQRSANSYTPGFAPFGCASFEAKLSAFARPLLGPEQAKHCDRFANAHTRCLRLLARALLRHGLNMLTITPPPASLLLGRDTAGRPVLPGFFTGFAYSETAAFCLLGKDTLLAESLPLSHTSTHDARATREHSLPALDAEACNALPPAARAFAPGELPMHLPSAAAARLALRCWIAKEAQLKSSGLGLSRDPAGIAITTTVFGAPNASGTLATPSIVTASRTSTALTTVLHSPFLRLMRLTMPGHMLCLALPKPAGTLRIRPHWFSCAALV